MKKPFHPLNYRKGSDRRKAATAIFLQDAMIHICERHGTNNMMEIANKDYSDYAALRILDGLTALVTYT